MRVTLLFLGLVNLVLVGFLVSATDRPALSVSASGPEDKATAILARLTRMGEAEEKRNAVVAELRKELATARQDLAVLRADLASLDEKAQKASVAVRIDTAKLVGLLEKPKGTVPEKKPMQPPIVQNPPPMPNPPGVVRNPPQGEAKQLAELTAELKKLNDRFKRVIDFAAGRSGLE